MNKFLTNPFAKKWKAKLDKIKSTKKTTCNSTKAESKK